MPTNKTSTNISANTLFHFTKRSNFFRILETASIYPQYCIEIDPFYSSTAELATPMACFCDIPISLIKKHIKTYGTFGIGLSKEWGMKHKIDPVLYYHDNSSMQCIIHETLVALSNPKENASKYLFSKLLQTSLYAKRYEGPNKKGKICRFYDEREWRFVPSKQLLDDLEMQTTLVDEKLGKQRKQYNELLKKHCRIMFEPRDIKYLIISSAAQVPKLLKIVNRNWPTEINSILPKVITIDQINDDI